MTSGPLRSSELRLSALLESSTEAPLSREAYRITHACDAGGTWSVAPPSGFTSKLAPLNLSVQVILPRPRWGALLQLSHGAEIPQKHMAFDQVPSCSSPPPERLARPISTPFLHPASCRSRARGTGNSRLLGSSETPKACLYLMKTIIVKMFIERKHVIVTQESRPKCQ